MYSTRKDIIAKDIITWDTMGGDVIGGKDQELWGGVDGF